MQRNSGGCGCLIPFLLVVVIIFADLLGAFDSLNRNSIQNWIEEKQMEMALKNLQTLADQGLLR